MKRVFGLVVALLISISAHAEEILIAAAADLKFAMEEVVSAYKQQNPNDKVAVAYGSSGKFFAQIQQAGPFDIFFSADITYPRELKKLGFAASEVTPYAIGRIVLWSNSVDASKLTLSNLTDPRFQRIAIANPKHAPYGKRAEEAMRAAKVWDEVSGRLVMGENIAHAAQFVTTSNAQIGIIALSLALNPELKKQGSYALIPDTLHQPLEQGFIITKRAENTPVAKRFAAFMSSQQARKIMENYGFVLPR